MLAFRITLNDRTPLTAGIDGPHVVSVIVSSVLRTDDAREKWPAGKRFRRKDLDLHVGGLVSAEQAHVDWLNTNLKIGDRITIDVIDAPSADAPRRQRPPKAKVTKSRAGRR